MKKRHLALIFASLLIVGGCGTNSTNTDENNTDTKEQTGSAAESNGTENKADKENKEDLAASPKDGAEATLIYTLNGEKKEGSATRVESDNQDFSIQLLPEFELISEEPRKDILLLKNNPAISMRIELLPANADWTVYENNVSIELSNVSDKKYDLTEKTLLMDHASAYEAKNEEECVTIYLIKDSELPLKLTLFTNSDEDYRSAFVEMAKTISKLQ